MSEVEISELRIALDQPIRANAPPTLKDVFGEDIAQSLSAWAHVEGESRFDYPRVQFKAVDSQLRLWGVNEGSGWLREQFETRTPELQIEFSDSRFETYETHLETASEAVEYRFVTPWLALNRRNFGTYTQTHSRRNRKDELSRILVANVMGLAKSLDVEFDEWVNAETSGLTSVKTRQGGQGAIGFIGTFRINVLLPDYMGLGKSAQFGFGTQIPN